MIPNLGGVFPLGHGDGWIWKNNGFTCCLLYEKGETPKMASCGASNFEGDGLHLYLLQNPQNFESSSFVIHITYNVKVANFLKFVAQLKCSWDKKIKSFFNIPLDEGLVHMSIWPSKCGPIDFKLS